MHTFLDKSFYIYVLKDICVEIKVKYSRLAIIFALLVFCEVAQRSSYGMSRFDFFFFNWYDSDAMEGTKVLWDTAGCVCLHWCCVCHVGGNSFECDIFFVFSVELG